jgi:hypothetical protein
VTFAGFPGSRSPKGSVAAAVRNRQLLAGGITADTETDMLPAEKPGTGTDRTASTRNAREAP